MEDGRSGRRSGMGDHAAVAPDMLGADSQEKGRASASSECDWPATPHRRQVMPLRHTERRLTLLKTFHLTPAHVAERSKAL